MNRSAMKSFAVRARHDLLNKIEHKMQNAEKNGMLSKKIKELGFDAVKEEAAFICFVRSAALCFMKANGFLPEEYDLSEEKTELETSLPWLFGSELDWVLPLIPVETIKNGGIMQDMMSEISRKEWREGVEIIGWLYQYFMSEKHEEIVNVYKGTVKKEDIPAATQLFTTEWIVKYMVDNSLGRYYLERNAESGLRKKLQYLIDSEKKASAKENVNPLELTFFDPCMGSGHILVYAFDVLIEIYRECGFDDSEAAQCIVKHNLFGTDIDDRCARIACFALMMKGRSYDADFLKKGIKPNLLAIEEGRDIKIALPDREHNETLSYLEKIFRHGKETGSLIKTEQKDYIKFYDYVQKHTAGEMQNHILHLVKQAEILTGRYTVVCTNPPYMNKPEGNLRDYVNLYYKPYAGDLFSVFMYRNFDFCKVDGYCAFMTPFVWMFIRNYENLRRFIIEEKSIVNLVQLEYSAYEDATVPICTFVLKNSKSNETGQYIRLSDFKGGMEVQKQKIRAAAENPDCGYIYKAEQSDFLKIPHAPIVYWASESVIKAFSEEKTAEDISRVKIGMGTGKNERFLRNWWEVSLRDIDFALTSIKELPESHGKWFPYNKGGDFRLWYGNLQEVIWFDEEGRAKLRETSGYRENGGFDFYFREGITWTFISSSKFGVRYRPFGSVFDVAGSTLFADRAELYYLLALMSSVVGDYILKMLNPTMNYQAGNIKNLPVIFGKEQEVQALAKENISISKEDWDSFETSWDFRRHPLL